MKLSQRFRKFFRSAPPEAGAAGHTQPVIDSGPDLDRRIAEWTEVVEGGVPPASVDVALVPRDDAC